MVEERRAKIGLGHFGDLAQALVEASEVDEEGRTWKLDKEEMMATLTGALGGGYEIYRYFRKLSQHFG